MEDIFTKNIWYLGRFEERWIAFKITEIEDLYKGYKKVVFLIETWKLEEIIENEIKPIVMSIDEFIKKYEERFYYVTSEDMKSINIHLIEE